MLLQGCLDLTILDCTVEVVREYIYLLYGQWFNSICVRRIDGGLNVESVHGEDLLSSRFHAFFGKYNIQAYIRTLQLFGQLFFQKKLTVETIKPICFQLAEIKKKIYFHMHTAKMIISICMVAETVVNFEVAERMAQV